jgi:hypothetical protein
MKTTPSRHHESRMLQGIMIVLLLILLTLLILFAREYMLVRNAQIGNGVRFRMSSLFRRHPVPLTASDVGLIRPWMTFDYLDRTFNLPPAYLEKALSITDPSYPRLSIQAYASHSHRDPSSFMSEVIAAVSNYFNATSTRPAATSSIKIQK